MPTSKQYRYQAQECRELAEQTSQVYSKTALLELAADFCKMARELERGKMSASQFERPDYLQLFPRDRSPVNLKSCSVNS
jgi:molecular chaperone GrpE (heat shock protein)